MTTKCPICKEKLTTIAESQIGRQIYIYHIKNNWWDIPSYGEFDGEHEKWQCPNCGEELPEEIIRKAAPDLLTE